MSKRPLRAPQLIFLAAKPYNKGRNLKIGGKHSFNHLPIFLRGVIN